jgi:ribosomal protein S7
MRYREFRIVETLILTELTDRVKQQIRERFKQENDLLTDEQINYYLDRWDRYVNTFEPQFRDITRLAFAQVERLIDDAVARSEIKGQGEVKQFDPNDDMIYNRNNLTILKGDLREKCINYGQGYTWCISRRDASNMFYTYRMRMNEPMFYFVFDKDRPRNDVWHAVVIYVDSTGTYHAATATNPGDEQMTWDQIVRKQPKLKGLQQLFVHQPLTPEERSDYEKYGRRVGLEKYSEFSLREKLKYIQFGHPLAVEQQDATPKELIGVYAKMMPTRITLNTWNRLNPSDRRKVEEGRIAAVRENGLAIELIIEGGITPSEAVQLAAVKKHSPALRIIMRGGITPSEPVQLAAVSQNSSTIRYIIKGGIKPNEAVQLAAVNQDGHAIYHIIIEGGITPSEPVQLAAVKKYGIAIRYIIDAGIKPSEAVQLAAVNQNGHAIYHIIRAGIEPSEAVQLAAVNQNGDAIQRIIRGGITPSAEVRQAAKRDPQ